jgi:cyclopropane fatty-acyl-phospholipid synthase-like methyltransferase
VAAVTEHDVRAFYDSAGQAYSDLMGPFWHHGFSDAEDRGLSPADAAKEVAEFFVTEAGLRPGERALDFGSGVGGSTCHMAHVSGATFVGVSNNEWLSDQARQYAAAAGLADQVHFLTVGSTDYKTFAAWPEGAFDLVTFAESVCHLPDKQAFFTAAHRILKPGGTLAGVDWLQRPYGEYHTDEQIKTIMDPVETAIRIPWHGTVTGYRDMITAAGFTVHRAVDMWEGRTCWGSTPVDDGQGWYQYDGPDAELFHRGKKALMDAKASGVFTVGLFVATR